MSNRKKLSVIIVNFNGRLWLEKALPDVFSQNYSNLQVIVVDNDSTDDSVSWLRDEYPSVVLIENTVNVGFASGNNIGILKSDGEYVFLLNNDIQIKQTNFFSRIVQYMEDNPDIDVVQPKMLWGKDESLLDVAGSFWTPTTLLYHHGYHKRQSHLAVNIAQPVFTVKGAAMCMRRSIIDSVGLFDDSFWCYYEETDFCHRVWMSGGQCWYFPEAEITHFEGSTADAFSSSFIQFHSLKNKLRSYLKNFSIVELLYVLPMHIAFLLVFMFVSVVRGNWRLASAALQSVFWNVQHISETLRMRSRIQKSRLPAFLFRFPHPAYYYYAFVGLSKLPERYILD